VGSLGHTKPVTAENNLTITAKDAVLAVLYIVALAVLYKFTHKYMVIFLILCAALAGHNSFMSELRVESQLQMGKVYLCLRKGAPQSLEGHAFDQL
jgi:hypothetical protein